MKKILLKDQKFRKLVKKCNKKYYLLKFIVKNRNIFILVRYRALLVLKILNIKHASIISISNRCLLTYSKKRLNKNTFYGRSIFLKKIQQGKVVGFKKSSW